ncbi:MAG: hypothetical protein LBI58_03110, partial [Tannerellaceae bacterium]|nr:hypothetical protein [Tannerellaceae bacterium]
NQCLAGGNRLEHEENDGKTEEKDFVFYFPPVFSPEFISSRLLKKAFLRGDYIICRGRLIWGGGVG